MPNRNDLSVRYQCSTYLEHPGNRFTCCDHTCRKWRFMVSFILPQLIRVYLEIVAPKTCLYTFFRATLPAVTQIVTDLQDCDLRNFGKPHLTCENVAQRLPCWSLRFHVLFVHSAFALRFTPSEPSICISHNLPSMDTPPNHEHSSNLWFSALFKSYVQCKNSFNRTQKLTNGVYVQ